MEPNPRDPGITCDLEKWTGPLILLAQMRLQFLCIAHHGAKFVASENFSLATGAWRAVKDRARRVQLDEHSDGSQHGRQQHRRYTCTENVHQPLQHQPDRRQFFRMQADDGQLANSLDFVSDRLASEEFWHDL